MTIPWVKHQRRLVGLKKKKQALQCKTSSSLLLSSFYFKVWMSSFKSNNVFQPFHSPVKPVSGSLCSHGVLCLVILKYFHGTSISSPHLDRDTWNFGASSTPRNHSAAFFVQLSNAASSFAYCYSIKLITASPKWELSKQSKRWSMS